MKKTFFIVSLCFITSVSFAQIIDESQVPIDIKDVFTKEYPSTKADSWEKKENEHLVKFLHNDKVTYMLIGPNINIIYTETEITKEELPKNVSSYLKKNYPNDAILKAVKNIDYARITTYKIQIHASMLLFDAEGNIVK